MRIISQNFIIGLTAFFLLTASCKNMNKTQKGAVIGTAGGAAVGAVIGKAAGNTALWSNYRCNRGWRYRSSNWQKDG